MRPLIDKLVKTHQKITHPTDKPLKTQQKITPPNIFRARAYIFRARAYIFFVPPALGVRSSGSQGSKHLRVGAPVEASEFAKVQDLSSMLNVDLQKHEAFRPHWTRNPNEIAVCVSENSTGPW